MVHVARNQTAQIVGIFTRPAAPALKQQELDAVNVLKHAGPLRVRAVPGRAATAGVFQLAFPIEFRQFSHLPPIDLRRGKPKFLFEGLFQDPDVSVLTKYQGNHQPVVPRPNLAVGALVAQKGAAFPARNIRRLPAVRT